MPLTVSAHIHAAEVAEHLRYQTDELFEVLQMLANMTVKQKHKFFAELCDERQATGLDEWKKVTTFLREMADEMDKRA